MGALANIFSPIVGFKEIDLDDVRIVAFDTNGTLVHRKGDGLSMREYVADQDTARLFRDLNACKAKLGLDEVVIISGHPEQATELLERTGLRDLAVIPVEDRMMFYARTAGKNVLVVDDDYLLASEAQAHVDPKSETVKKYLQDKTYRHELRAL